MKGKASRLLSLGFGVLVSAAMLYYVFSGVDWGVFFVELHKVNFAYLPISFLVFVSFSLIRAKRWQYLLGEDVCLPYKNAVNLVLLTQFAAFVLPFRAGEFVRPWLLGSRKIVSFSRALASIVTERVFDVVVMLCLASLVFARFENLPMLVSLGAKALGMLALVICLVMFAAYFAEGRVIAAGKMLTSFVFRGRWQRIGETLLQMGVDFIAGVRGVSSLSSLFMVIVWSLVWWLVTGLFCQSLMMAMGMPADFLAGLLTSIMVGFAIAAPSAPGFIGTFQFGCLVALHTLMGYPKEQVIAFSIVSHGVQFLGAIVPGIYALKAEGVKIFDIQGASNADQGDVRQSNVI